MSNIADDLKPLAKPISKLKSAEHNPRKGDVEAIKKSYERFGQRKPIVASKSTGEIVAGNHQFQAAKELGWKEIAVVYVDDDRETALAYSVADNRIGQLGEWNVEELVLAFDEIDPEDFASIGFSEVEVEDFRALADELEMDSVPAVAPVEGSNGDKDVDTEQTVKKDATYAEFLERYANRAVRAIILYYPNDDYEKMVTDLKDLGKQLGTEDNAETVQKLIQERLKDG